MTTSPHSHAAQRLNRHWSRIHHGAGEAIAWTQAVRASAPRLDDEADDLIFSLRRARNTAKRLGAASQQPMTVGLFGLSQAGKSYLISALAAGQNGKLETRLGGQRLDFLTHINPPGGGKEATGLVTRFSRTAVAGPDAFPLELKLFSEIEWAKVLANSFFNDFNPEKVHYRLDGADIAERLRDLGKRRQLHKVPGVDEDDVVALWDYLQENFRNSLSALPAHYWETAVELAPWLAIEDRTRLFSVFWGEIGELDAAYLAFARVLADLGHAERVFAPLEALVRDTGNGLSQADSIMNVDMLERLGSRSDRRIEVRPLRAGELGAAVELGLAELAALTAELVFPLLEATAEPLFEEVDLLDFPGYRGRLAVESLDLDAVRRAVGREDASPVAQLILRGKVAYLFERYTDSQEMNVLIVCTPSNKQSDVTSVGPVLSRWIERTQGATPAQRALRKPGLLWAITMFDMRISSDLDKGEDLLRLGWGNGGMMKMCMLERFGQYAWLQEWTDGHPFANTFLVRKPRMQVTFLDTDGEYRELAVREGARSPLALMRKTFCEDETVCRHVAEPEAAWDAMLALNDGGIQRIGQYLRTVAQREVKLQRMEEQLNDMLHQIDTRLGHWFMAEGAGELEKKRRIARTIYAAIWPRRVLLGELLWHMQLSEERLRMLYLRASSDILAPSPADSGSAPVALPATGALNLGDGLDGDDGFDLFGTPPSPSPRTTAQPAPQHGSDAHFAQSVLREWISHLRHLPDDAPLMTFLGFDKAAIEALADELITAASRLDLQGQLLRAISSTEQAGSKHEQLAGRQVLTARTVLGDFIGWLGFAALPPDQRPGSQIVPGAQIFQPPPPIPADGLPPMSEQAHDYTRQYIGDWLVGMARLAEANAGHSAGLEITPEQNDALGRILQGLHQAGAEGE